MKTNHVKMRHPIVLGGAVILTVISIACSVAVADFAPIKDLNQIVKTTFGEDNAAVSEKNSEQQMSNKNESNSSIDLKRIDFKSVVNPKLSSCFNCGEIVAIESKRQNIEGLDLEMTQDLGINQLGEYLDAHRDITRMVLPDESSRYLANNTVDPDIKNTIIYVIKVRMPNGSEYTLTQDTPPTHDVGDTIRVMPNKTITA